MPVHVWLNDYVLEQDGKNFMYLKVENISKKYGRKSVLEKVGFEAGEGECLGILGANGCGKSTLLSILAGVLKADEGSFFVDGENVFSKTSPSDNVVGYVPQQPPLMEELSAKDNLKLWYCNSVLDMKKELNSGILAMLGIDEFLNVRVSKMSGGMKKRLSIGCAVANNPHILILDEPGAALDLVCKERIYSYLKDFKSKGGIVLISIHEEYEINLCSRHYMLKNKKLTRFEYDGNIHRLVGCLGATDDLKTVKEQ